MGGCQSSASEGENPGSSIAKTPSRCLLAVGSFFHPSRKVTKQRKSGIEMVEVFQAEFGCGWLVKTKLFSDKKVTAFFIIWSGVNYYASVSLGVGPSGSDGDPRKKKTAGPQSGERHFFFSPANVSSLRIGPRGVAALRCPSASTRTPLGRLLPFLFPPRFQSQFI